MSRPRNQEKGWEIERKCFFMADKMIKDNLILLRKINGYSQEEIAEKIGKT